MNQFASPIAKWLHIHRSWHVPVLLLLAMAIRIPSLMHPGLVTEGWREADNASVAMNFYRNDFDLLHPQIYWGGDGPGYVEMEFPLVQFLTAGLYKLFGVHETLGTVVPLCSTLGLIITVYGLASLVFSSAFGFIAAVITAVSPPLAMYSTSFMVDPTMILCSTLAVYCFALWLESESWFQLVMSAIAMAIAVLLKPTALVTGVPIVFLCFARYGLSSFRRPRVLLYGLICLVPPILWYLHAHQLYAQFHNTFGILTGGMKKFATAEALLNPRFYALTLFRISVFHVTPIAFCFMILGAFTTFQDTRQYVFHAWCYGLLAYVIAVATGVMYGQYYLLAFVPPGSILASVGILRSFNIFHSRTGENKWPKFMPTLAIMIVVIFATSLVAATCLFGSRRRPLTTYWENEKRSGQLVDRVTRPGSLIVVANPQMNGLQPDQIMTPPEIFYFSDRRGWYVATSWVEQNLIDSLIQRGARYFVVSSDYINDFKANKASVYEYLRSRYQTIVDDENALVVDLHIVRSHK